MSDPYISILVIGVLMIVCGAMFVVFTMLCDYIFIGLMAGEDWRAFNEFTSSKQMSDITCTNCNGEWSIDEMDTLGMDYVCPSCGKVFRMSEDQHVYVPS